MTNLTSIEKLKFEKLFGMGSGYVLEFSNRTFQGFVAENVNQDIYDDKYVFEGTSKANRLRVFWDTEPASLVGKLLSALLECWKTNKLIGGDNITQNEQKIYDECEKIVEKLINIKTVANVDALKPNKEDENFQLLAKSIKESIEKGEPEAVLDRLHTFIVRYVRELCNKHTIDYDKNIPLHSLFGGYVKFLKQEKFIDSDMTERILKSSIAVLEAFNGVRNNQSFAHDNPVLNYNESVLIFDNISNTIKFIESVEQRIAEQIKKKYKEVITLDSLSSSEEEIEAAGDSWLQNKIDIQRGK
jgi:hypothetical protein